MPTVCGAKSGQRKKEFHFFFMLVGFLCWSEPYLQNHSPGLPPHQQEEIPKHPKAPLNHSRVSTRWLANVWQL